VCVEVNHKIDPKKDVFINIMLSGGKKLHNCTGVKVPEHLECYASETDPKGYKIKCKSTCDTCLPHGPVCASDHGHYPTKCEASKQMCKMYGKDKMDGISWMKCSDVSSRGYHAGTTMLSATKGREATSMNVVNFDSSMFHNYSDILVVVNVNRKNTGNDSHDAAIAWVENITSSEFTVYARALDTDPMYVNYVVYQKNIHTRTKGSLIGDSVLVNNFKEATCTGDINEGEYITSKSPGQMVASLHHHTAGNWQQTHASWIEQNRKETDKRRVCLREVTMSASVHTKWSVNWLKVGDSSTFFNYNDKVNVSAQERPDPTGPLCKSATFSHNRTRVIISSRKRTVSSDDYKKSVSYSALQSWIESYSPSTMRMCFDYSNPNENIHNSNEFEYIVFDPTGNHLNHSEP